MLAFGKLPREKRTPLIDRAIKAGVDFLFSSDPARADDQDAGALQRLLPRPAHFGQDQMPRIAFDFVFGKDHRPI